MKRQLIKKQIKKTKREEKLHYALIWFLSQLRYKTLIIGFRLIHLICIINPISSFILRNVPDTYDVTSDQIIGQSYFEIFVTWRMTWFWFLKSVQNMHGFQSWTINSFLCKRIKWEFPSYSRWYKICIKSEKWKTLILL